MISSRNGVVAVNYSIPSIYYISRIRKFNGFILLKNPVYRFTNDFNISFNGSPGTGIIFIIIKFFGLIFKE